MIKPKTNLFAKILFWIFINLTILPIILLIASTLFNHQIIIHDILSMQGHNRMRKAFTIITHDLSQIPQSEWNEKLKIFAAGYLVDLSIIFEDGTSFGSTELVEPNESIMKKIRYSIDQARNLQRDQSLGKKIPLLPEANPIHPDLLMQTSDPNLFWTGVVVKLPHGDTQEKTQAMLSSVSDSVTGNGFLVDPLPWVIMILGVIVISILLWIPVIRHITQPLARMTKVTEVIAKGNFDATIKENRSDEIGRLAKAINRMSSRLSAFVKGQKRFIGDIAHELGSPIARIQFGLGALEQRIDEKNRKRVLEIMEDVNHMSALVHELLALSRIEIDTQTVRLESAYLRPLVENAVKREFTSSTEIIIDVNEKTSVYVSPELLTRAVSNLIRNSIKYAGKDGPITISSMQKGAKVLLEVRDSGPGVAEKYLDQLFEPFFRLDPSRDRDSGGVGLGLAIVKTCIENCKGQVEVKNLEPKGFAVIITVRTG